jgi:tetratricopeptide (TPR) repeat protein
VVRGPESADASTRRYWVVRVACAGVIAVLLIALAIVQFASYALDARAAVPGSLPPRVPPGFGLAVYRALDRVAPAPFVESTLATQALAAGDFDAAERYALKLPASPARDELLAQTARARGDVVLALEYDIAAPDVDAVSQAAAALAGANPQGAYQLELHLKDRLEILTTHPDAVAEAYFSLGQFGNQSAWKKIPESPDQHSWLRRADGDFESAVALAPLSEKYALAAGNQAALLGNYARARQLFEQAAEIDPGGADALAGLGVAAFAAGDAATARAYLQRARALDPSALMVRALQRDLDTGRVIE